MSPESAPGATGGAPAEDAAPRTSRDDEAPSVDRLLALSDGVVAIALTLLVLELKVPSAALVGKVTSAGALGTQLAHDSGQWIAYPISFYVVAQFWLAHHRMFRHIHGQREGLAWWNFAFLFTITILPFTSNLLGEYANNPLAVDIFAVNLLAATLSTWATSAFSRREGVSTIKPGSPEARASLARALVNTAVIILSIGVAPVNTTAAEFCWLLLALAPMAANTTARHFERISARASLVTECEDAGAGEVLTVMAGR